MEKVKSGGIWNAQMTQCPSRFNEGRGKRDETTLIDFD
jgi:hypothetical protein